jgi:hypothetical protein
MLLGDWPFSVTGENIMDERHSTPDGDAMAGSETSDSG